MLPMHWGELCLITSHSAERCGCQQKPVGKPGDLKKVLSYQNHTKAHKRVLAYVFSGANNMPTLPKAQAPSSPVSLIGL